MSCCWWGPQLFVQSNFRAQFAQDLYVLSDVAPDFESIAAKNSSAGDALYINTLQGRRSPARFRNFSYCSSSSLCFEKFACVLRLASETLFGFQTDLGRMQAVDKHKENFLGPALWLMKSNLEKPFYKAWEASSHYFPFSNRLDFGVAHNRFGISCPHNLDWAADAKSACVQAVRFWKCLCKQDMERRWRETAQSRVGVWDSYWLWSAMFGWDKLHRYSCKNFYS